MLRPLVIILLSLALYPGLSQPANTNFSNGVMFDSEPYLAVNPVNSRNMVAAWMSMKYAEGLFRIAIKTRASFDGGNTWGNVTSLPHMGSGRGSADVSLAFAKTGILYIAYVDYRQAPDSGGVYVARSADGGLHWDTPSQAFDAYDVPVKQPIDRPWIVVDNSSTLNQGTLYITTKPPPWIPAPNRNYYKVSSDGGFTWSPIATVDGGTHLIGDYIASPMAAPATTINGKFCAIYPSYVPSQNLLPAFYLASSYNQGQSFTYTTVYAAVPAVNDTNLKNAYQLLAHPSDSNKMVFLMPDARNGDADLMALHSNNGGHTWSMPVRINDDAISNGKAQDMVWGAYNEQGKLVVVWRDRRNAPESGFWNAGYDFYYATSSDNGQTFSVNKKLSSQFITFDSITSLDGNDFMSCTYHGDTLCSVWGDTRNGKMNIWFASTIAGTNSSIVIELLNGGSPAWDISPNPAYASINIAVSPEMIGQSMQIFDATGGQRFSGTFRTKNMQLSVEQYPSGIYFIKSGNLIKRFMKE